MDGTATDSREGRSGFMPDMSGINPDLRVKLDFDVGRSRFSAYFAVGLISQSANAFFSVSRQTAK